MPDAGDLPTVLIIDDEPHIVDNLADLVEVMGYRAETASNGTEGVEKCRAVAPDLILCDVMMPDGDGGAVLQAVRRSETLADTPFIVLTANVSLSEQQRASLHRADAQLTKPFRADDLLALIERFLSDA